MPTPEPSIMDYVRLIKDARDRVHYMGDPGVLVAIDEMVKELERIYIFRGAVTIPAPDIPYKPQPPTYTIHVLCRVDQHGVDVVKAVNESLRTFCMDGTQRLISTFQHSYTFGGDFLFGIFEFTKPL